MTTQSMVDGDQPSPDHLEDEEVEEFAHFDIVCNWKDLLLVQHLQIIQGSDERKQVRNEKREGFKSEGRLKFRTKHWQKVEQAIVFVECTH